MSKKVFKNEDGIWVTNFTIHKNDSAQTESFTKYLNELDPFFTLASEKSEFQFLLTLFRFRGMQDAGWDPFENLEQAHEEFKKLNQRDGEDLTKHYALFLYGLIIEASEPYEFLANLLNVIEGDSYIIKNFKDYTDSNGRQRSLHPLDKISQLQSRAKKVKLKLTLFDEFVDNKLRNAIFHSDYAVYGSEVRVLNPTHNYKQEEWIALLNRCFSYWMAFLHLYKGFIGQYDEPKVIDPSPGFSENPEEKITLIIREGYGVIGMKDSWTPEQLKKGFIPHRIGRFLPYELILIEKGETFLPPNKIERFNRRIRFLPRFFQRFLVKKFRKNYGV